GRGVTGCVKGPASAARRAVGPHGHDAVDGDGVALVVGQYLVDEADAVGGAHHGHVAPVACAELAAHEGHEGLVDRAGIGTVADVAGRAAAAADAVGAIELE